MPRRNHSVPCGRVRRSAPIAGLTARVVCGRFVAGLREKAGADGAVERFDQHMAARYTELLGRSRGVLMKAGQILSMADVREWGGGGFGPYLEALRSLQTDVPPMPPELVAELLKTELGAAAEHFVDFEWEPIAAASIGQVHRAVLRDGRQVAVKVQYPGVARAINDDLANAELLATFLKVAGASTVIRSDIRAVAREAAARIREEVDYRHEAAMITAFGDLYAGHPFIRIPQVVPEASGDRVLTMTYLEGMDFAAAQRAGQDLKNTWAEAIMRFAYSNRRLANLLHADPHPGNYRFCTDGTVGFLDYGCVQVLTERERRGWFAMIRAAVEGRKADLRDLAARVGFLDADPTLSAEDLYDWAAEVLHDIILESQPVTYTPETRDRVIRNAFGVRDSDHPIARVSLPGVVAFTARIQLNLVTICAALQATLPVRAIVDDLDGAAEPITEMGRQHHAWVQEKGLELVPHPLHE